MNNLPDPIHPLAEKAAQEIHVHTIRVLREGFDLCERDVAMDAAIIQREVVEPLLADAAILENNYRVSVENEAAALAKLHALTEIKEHQLSQ